MSNTTLHLTLLTLLAIPVMAMLIPSTQRKFLFGLTLLFQIVCLISFSKIALQGDFPSIHIPLLGEYGVNYFVEWNSLNQYLVILSGVIFPLALIAGYLQIQKRFQLFCVLLTLTHFLVVETFLAQNLILFYLFWESSIIPMFFIIGIWGGSGRIVATFKFILFTSFGSLMMLLSILYLGVVYYQTVHAFQFDLPIIRELIPHLSVNEQVLLFIGFSLAFIIKIPVPPFHNWLPYAHVEAPTAGSMVLAAILLKLGSFGFLQYSLQLFPQLFEIYQLPFALFFIVGAIYAGMLAMVQDDLKKIVAYSSIAHMGLIMFGLCFKNLVALHGAVLAMIGHGFTSAGLFFAVGVLYERSHTRSMKDIGTGLAHSSPLWSLCFFLLLLSSIGFPLTVGFSGEFMILAGAFHYSLEQLTLSSHYLMVSYLALTVLIIGTLYHMRIVRKILFGPSQKEYRTLCRTELVVFIILIIPVFILGLFPNIVTLVTHI